MEPLKNGQRVLLNVVKLSGTVIDSGRADADSGLGEEGTVYEVHFAEQTIFVRRENLVGFPAPDGTLQYGSSEWNAELERFTILAGKRRVSPNDQGLFHEICESGSRLGFLVPVK